MTRKRQPECDRRRPSPPSRYADGPEDPRLVWFNAPRFGLARLAIMAARGARMPAPDLREPFELRQSPTFHRRNARQPGTDSALSP